ncbi:MAG: RDD family protein [Clostridiales bacterium]|nr:RDD family protein [Clostridiales bacterium]
MINKEMFENRIKAFIIDGILLILIQYLLLALYFKSGKSDILFTISYIYPILFLFKDIFGGMSIGRRVIGIRIVKVEGGVPKIHILVLRTMLSIITVIFDILDHKKYEERYVDRLLKTKVVYSKM